MKIYLIAIGGTGAKCIESFLYLNAISDFGIKETIEYELFFIDSDNTGNYDNLKNSIKGYETIKSEMKKIDRKKVKLNPDLNLFSNVFINNDKCSIAEDLGANFVSLCKRTKEYTGHATEEDLLKTLFEPGHIGMEFQEGFHGFPNIGTLVTKHFMKKPDNKWREFIDKIEKDNNNDSQIVLLGSVFGGTGASGIPAVLEEIARIGIHKRKKVHVAMMLPYFKLPKPPEHTDRKIYGITDIDLNSAYALEYYKSVDKEILDEISFILVGQQEKDWIQNYAEGRADQNNKAMIAEMVSGFLIMNAIKKNLGEMDENQDSKMYFCGYNDDAEGEQGLSFSSVPCDDDFVEKMVVLRFMAMIFIEKLKSIFIKVNNNKDDEALYVFEQRLEALNTESLDNIESFFSNFLDWSRELNYVNKEHTDIVNIDEILFSNEKTNERKGLYSFDVHKDYNNKPSCEFDFDVFVKKYNEYIRDTDAAKIFTLLLGTLLPMAVPTFGVIDTVLQLSTIIIKVLRKGE